MSHYDYADLPWQPRQYREEAVLDLNEGESAPDPGCPTCRLWGPARLTYTRWQDGGIDVIAFYLPLSMQEEFQ